MKFKTEKNLRIINELMAFCYHFHSDDISVNIKTINNKSTIKINALIYNFPKRDYDNLIETLNIPRQHEVEQYYWQLGGESEFDCELSLVGMMVDTAKVKYADNILYIELERIENS